MDLTVADAYQGAGHDVCVVDDLSTGHRSNLPKGARFYECDIRDPNLAKIFEYERPDVVNHQAAKANVRESFDTPVFYADVNVAGSSGPRTRTFMAVRIRTARATSCALEAYSPRLR